MIRAWHRGLHVGPGLKSANSTSDTIHHHSMAQPRYQNTGLTAPRNYTKLLGRYPFLLARSSGIRGAPGLPRAPPEIIRPILFVRRPGTALSRSEMKFLRCVKRAAEIADHG